MKIFKAHTRFSAFTLPEIVISLLLMSVLFSTGAIVYMIVDKQGKQINSRNRFYTEFIAMKQILKRDFSKPCIAYISEDTTKIDLYYPGSETGAPEYISYLFDSTHIVRLIETRADTFSMGGIIEQVKIMTDSIPIVTDVKIRSWYNNKPLFLRLRKAYAARDYFTAINKKQSGNE